jgi:hypothetical protein
MQNFHFSSIFKVCPTPLGFSLVHSPLSLLLSLCAPLTKTLSQRWQLPRAGLTTHSSVGLRQTSVVWHIKSHLFLSAMIFKSPPVILPSPVKDKVLFILPSRERQLYVFIPDPRELRLCSLQTWTKAQKISDVISHHVVSHSWATSDTHTYIRTHTRAHTYTNKNYIYLLQATFAWMLSLQSW